MFEASPRTSVHPRAASTSCRLRRGALSIFGGWVPGSGILLREGGAHREDPRPSPAVDRAATDRSGFRSPLWACPPDSSGHGGTKPAGAATYFRPRAPAIDREATRQIRTIDGRGTESSSPD